MEYLLAKNQNELAWVRGVADDLRNGKLHWDEAWLEQTAREFSELHREQGA
jgi:hypothetical protein